MLIKQEACCKFIYDYLKDDHGGLDKTELILSPSIIIYYQCEHGCLQTFVHQKLLVKFGWNFTWNYVNDDKGNTTVTELIFMKFYKFLF